MGGNSLNLISPSNPSASRSRLSKQTAEKGLLAQLNSRHKTVASMFGRHNLTSDIKQWRLYVWNILTEAQLANQNLIT